MDKKKLLKHYNKLMEASLSYQEKMALSLEFLDNNSVYNIYESNIIIEDLLEEAKEKNDQASLAELYLKKAWFEVDLGQHMNAKKSLDKSQKLYSLLDNPKGIMSSHTALGYVNSIMGNHQEGFGHYQKALEIALKLKKTESLVPIYGNMAADLLDLGRLEEALSYYLKILDLEQSSEHKIITLKGLGYTYYLLEDYEKALLYLREAYKLASAEKIDSLKSGILMRLASVYQKLGDFKEAELAYKTTLEYGSASRLPRIEMNALFLLGQLYKEEGRLDLALEYFHKSYDLAVRTNILPSQINSLKSIWQTLTECFKWQEAFTYLKMFHRKELEFHNQETHKALDRFKMEEAIREKEFYQEMRSGLALISAIGKELASFLEVDNIVKVMYKQLQNFMDTNLFGLGLYDESNKELEFHFYLEGNKWSENSKLDYQDKNSLIVWSIKNKKEILLNNLKEESANFLADISKLKSVKMGVNSLIYAPLLVGTRVVGILSVQSYQFAAYNDYQLEMLKALAAYAAIALENARFFNEVKQLAITDPLTGLYNRRYFLELANLELERFKAYEKNFSLIMLDLDHFKKINDLYGHNSGDMALKEVANFLTRGIRRTDLLCRYGGEEFLLLFPDMTLKEAMVKANNLKEGLNELVIKLNKGEKFSVTASFGVTTALLGDQEIEKIIKRADLALYEAKEKGRNTVSFKI